MKTSVFSFDFKRAKRCTVCIFSTLLFLTTLSIGANPTSSTLERVLKNKTLVVSVNQYYEPFYIEDPNPKFPGLDVEIATFYADYLGVSLKILPVREFSDHAKKLEEGSVDIAIGAISTNIERSKRVSFTDPYLITTPAALVNRQILPPEPEGQIITAAPFKSLRDLNVLPGLSFSVRSNTPNHDWLKSNYSNVPIYTYLDDFRALNELKKNNVNVYVADSFRIQALLQREPSLKSNYLALLTSVQEEHLAMAVQKDDIVLLRNLNFFIKEIRRSGWLNRKANQYFSNSGWVTKK
ncbi:MAG: amino acid ABC transporter substrate-binding protein [Leptospira sp.]|nr:amino acid ABC transporter substrate-binding protein [Leptospira sp.]